MTTNLFGKDRSNNNIENLEIIDDNEGRKVKDNTLGIYRNE